MKTILQLLIVISLISLIYGVKQFVPEDQFEGYYAVIIGYLSYLVSSVWVNVLLKKLDNGTE